MLTSSNNLIAKEIVDSLFRSVCACVHVCMCMCVCMRERERERERERNRYPTLNADTTREEGRACNVGRPWRASFLQ